MKNIRLKKEILIDQSEKKKTYNKGITLIALVITIILLLILASVSISILTGQNGILTQAQNAKIGTEQASTREKVDLAIVGAMAKTENGTLTVENLKSELLNYDIVPKNTKFPLEIEKDGQKITINSNGETLSYKEMGEITGKETENTSIKDSLGNYIVIPAGFKVINPNDNVTDGIVVEDVDHGATAGSQFVWIPVGDVIKDSEENIETITLSRYTFAADSDGTPINKGANEIENSFNSNYNHTEVNISTKGNITAKENIESEETGFRKSARDNHGYYIGRYEARTNTKRLASTTDDELTQLTVKPDEMVYNYVTQSQAAILSRAMYTDKNFESDLMNSYAWDTAVLFLQKFDNRINKIKPYSRQSSLNSSLASNGTNNLKDINKQDIICNVWDMASNCLEWTTENYSYISNLCTYRGGGYDNSDYYTSVRCVLRTSESYSNDSFRPLLYL